VKEAFRVFHHTGERALYDDQAQPPKLTPPTLARSWALSIKFLACQKGRSKGGEIVISASDASSLIFPSKTDNAPVL